MNKNKFIFYILISLLCLSEKALADVLCKNKKTGVVISRARSCQRTESVVPNLSLATRSTKSKPDNTTGLDLSVTRLNGSGGTLNTTGINLSVLGDSGGDSTNIGLLVNATGADTNYSAIFQGGNVGIGTANPSESLSVSGRMSLEQTTAPSSTADKLYNVGGILYWNGQPVATGTQSAGTITGVSAGTGLVGGGSTGNVALSIDTGTSANDIVQLNSLGELPAVSGANLTSLNATNLSTGVVSDSRLSSNVSLLGSSINLTSEVSGVLPVANGGTGASSLSNLITLNTHTTGNYVSSVATGIGLSGGASGSEGATLTLSLDQSVSPTWTSTHSFTGDVNIGTSTASDEKLHLNGRMLIDTSTAPSVTTNKLYNVAGDLFFNGKNLTQDASGGDITSVVAGTGLTGGATTGDATLNVDTGTTANKIVALNGSAQLPAVSGANLTDLNASNISSGTISDSRLNPLVSLLGTSIDLTSEITGVLPVANGGTGANSFNNLFTLGTHTQGNYVAGLTGGTGILVSGSAGEASTHSISVDQANAYTWTGMHTFNGVTNDITTGVNEHFAIMPNGSGKVGIGTTSPSAKIDSTLSSTSATAATEIGSAVNLTDTGVVSTSTDITIGSDINVTRTGGASGGTFDTRGLDILVTGDTGGSSTNTGVKVDVNGADINYSGLFTGGRFGIGTLTPNSNFETVTTSASISAADETANQFSFTDTGVVTSGNDNSFGIAIDVTRTGATGGTISTTGLDITVTGDAGGDSTTTGLNVNVGSADNNIAAKFIGGDVSIGGSDIITSTNIPGQSLVVDNGIICVDNSGDNCNDSLRTAGTIYAANTTVASVDLAEEFPIEENDIVEAGDIVLANTKVAKKCIEFKKDSTGTKVCTKEENGKIPFVTKTSSSSATKKILGVISTKPGMTLGGFGQDELIKYKKVPLTLAGRVPVKVNNENGIIELGDRIAASSVPGVGRKANDGEISIGIALEDSEDVSSIQKILVLVK
jgi:hypothetical protein